MHYIIYKITNNINGRYYIGRHATSNLDDGYMGSGIGILNAIKKYGVQNFTKEIIATTDSSEKLWELEKEIVNETVVKDPLSYNMAYGGKHYLHGLKQYDYDAFIAHQSHAGQHYAKNFKGHKKEWHQKGGRASSQKRSEQYIYKITTSDGIEYVVNGIQFKELCVEKNWNYHTLHWTKSIGRPICRGPLKGFCVIQLASYNNPSS